MNKENGEKAKAWLIGHYDHVRKICRGDNTALAPSKEDEGQPQLWKPCHWRWFISKKSHKKRCCKNG